MKRFLIIGFFCFFMPAAGFSQKTAWPEGWKYRLTLEVAPPDDVYPVENVGLVDFFGKAEEDGSDIRIFDAGGQEIPLLVVSARGDNRYQVAFPSEGGTFYLYHGNPRAASPGYSWKPQRGLILEVYERKGANIKNWESVKLLVEESRKGRPVGRSFWGRVWDGTNPFGGEKNTVRIYEGYFYLSSPRTFTFATSSAGPSYILVDGRLVTSWEGWHRAEPFVRPERAGKVSLARGLHRFTYYHVGRPWQQIAVAAVEEGKTGRFDVIPEKFFLHVAKASVSKGEASGERVAAGFEWENTNYLKREGWELLTFRFRDTSFSDAAIKEWRWSFGDGHEDSGREVYHTYLKAGEYSVSLNVKDEKGNAGSILLNVSVEQDYSKRRILPLGHRRYLDEFKKFDLGKLRDDSLLVLAGIYESYDRFKEAFEAYKALNKRPLDGKQRRKVSLVAASLAEKQGDYAYAEQVYKKLIGDKHDSGVLLKLAALYLETGELEKAENLYHGILGSPDADGEAGRKALIGKGDIWRIKGEYARALEIYEKLSGDESAPFKAGAFAQAVAYYLGEKDFSAAFENLVRWAEEIPAAKLQGSWSVLLGRTYLLRKDYKKALGELEVFMKICPSGDNPYLPIAEYLMGESCEGMGEKKRAEEFYAGVADKYPFSRAADMALKKLEELGR